MREPTCWWATRPSPGNLGDVLTPVILRGLGRPVAFAARERAELLAIGSIVKFARAGQTVWGSGAMSVTNRPSPDARYLAVRGPITRDVVQANGGTCPAVYGDPALLLPRFHARPVEVRYPLGVVPHYVDHAALSAAHKGDRNVRLIPVLRKNPLHVVDEIRACESIVSSSLHGIIVAHAYGIPAAWVRPSNKLCGDDTKFRDYAASVGVELVPYATVHEAAPVLGSLDTGPLLQALGGVR